MNSMGKGHNEHIILLSFEKVVLGGAISKKN
jgi:hypothetical protein